jgi:hypothetical protein
MKVKNSIQSWLLALLTSFVFAAVIHAQPADFVLTGGKVYTVNEKQPWAEAVAVKGKEIIYVGDNAGAQAFIRNNTESIDLKGRLLLPGFVESHIHIGVGAGTTSGVTLESTDSRPLRDVPAAPTVRVGVPLVVARIHPQPLLAHILGHPRAGLLSRDHSTVGKNNPALRVKRGEVTGRVRREQRVVAGESE